MMLLVATAIARAGNPIVNDSTCMQKLSGTYTSDVHIYAQNGVWVEGTVRMASGAKIIVHPGGFLKIWNATITHVDDLGNYALANKFWGGIVVLGNPNLNQNTEMAKLCINNHMRCFPEAAAQSTTAKLCNGGMKECFGKINQGMVYINNSTIRYAQVGISVGDIANTPWAYIIPDGPQGGGLVYAVNSKFENNKNVSISFAPYFKHLQQSCIQKCTFKHIFKSGQYGSTLGHIATNKNTFKHPIKNNYFGRDITTYFGGSNGIITWATDATINDNKFDNLESGISSFTFKPTLVKVEVKNNTFYDIHSSAISLANPNNVNISGNKIYLNRTFSVGSCLGIQLADAKITSVFNNTISRLKSTSTNEHGIIIQNDFKQSCAVNFNNI